MIILHIETSTNVCSIAISKNGSCIFQKSNSDGLNHATMLSPFIEEALHFLKKNNEKIDAVAVSSGPGSYTGLRIGVSTAKGICYALNLPLISVDTLRVLTAMAIKKLPNANNTNLFCPMIDARRMEVYTALYDGSLNGKTDINAKIIESDSFVSELSASSIYFFGNGADKCKNTIIHSNANYIDDIVPLAENMISLAETKFTNSEFEDVAYFEPFYLKEFQVTTAKNKQ